MEDPNFDCGRGKLLIEVNKNFISPDINVPDQNREEPIQLDLRVGDDDLVYSFKEEGASFSCGATIINDRFL